MEPRQSIPGGSEIESGQVVVKNQTRKEVETSLKIVKTEFASILEKQVKISVVSYDSVLMSHLCKKMFIKTKINFIRIFEKIVKKLTKTLTKSKNCCIINMKKVTNICL